MSLKTKLIAAFLIIGLVPALLITTLNLQSNSMLAEGMQGSYRAYATNVLDLIDRNLFERYGDVQAFGTNTIVQDTSSWYKTNTAENAVANAMNTYVDLYDLYALTLLVDRSGRVIAVNDRDHNGKALSTAYLYQKNFSDAAWFTQALAGQFTNNADNSLTGTVVEDVYIDSDVAKVYGDEGYAIGFSAPVRDRAGNVIAIWKNYAKFSLVEDIVRASYNALKAQGLAAAELTLLGRDGRVWVDYAPEVAGNVSIVRIPAVVGTANLLQRGYEPARAAAAGESGGTRANHFDRKVAQFVGYAHSAGALGFPGLGWSALVRIDESVALTEVNRSTTRLWWILGISVVSILGVAYVVSESIVRPIAGVINSLSGGAREVKTSAEHVTASSQSLAQGANDSAASLEETAASIEQISSMSVKNAENSDTAKGLSVEVRAASEAGATQMEEMSKAVMQIRESAQETEAILKTIDDIAFQTNLLALNAAVEAARAGDAGKGFAVVAEAVRTLAQQSAVAAKETGDKLKRSSEYAENGVVVAQRVGESLSTIRDRSIKAATLVEAIASATKEQTVGLSQISRAVGELDRVTQGNAAASEEAAAAGEELVGQSRALDSAVDALFRVAYGRERTGGSSSAPRSNGSWNRGRIVELDEVVPEPPSRRGDERYNGNGQVM